MGRQRAVLKEVERARARGDAVHVLRGVQLVGLDAGGSPRDLQLRQLEPGVDASEDVVVRLARDPGHRRRRTLLAPLVDHRQHVPAAEVGLGVADGAAGQGADPALQLVGEVAGGRVVRGDVVELPPVALAGRERSGGWAVEASPPLDLSVPHQRLVDAVDVVEQVVELQVLGRRAARASDPPAAVVDECGAAVGPVEVVQLGSAVAGLDLVDQPPAAPAMLGEPGHGQDADARDRVGVHRGVPGRVPPVAALVPGHVLDQLRRPHGRIVRVVHALEVDRDPGGSRSRHQGPL